MTAQRDREAGHSGTGYAGDLPATECWRRLTQDSDGQLIDVRTMAEWSFVGVPDLSPVGREAVFCEWQRFPAAVNPGFVDDVASALKHRGWRPGAALYFLCRSGARSRAAAIAMTAAGYGPCFNISDGFEGGLDRERHRGTQSGWKAAGLPWIQN